MAAVRCVYITCPFRDQLNIQVVLRQANRAGTSKADLRSRTAGDTVDLAPWRGGGAASGLPPGARAGWWGGLGLADGRPRDRPGTRSKAGLKQAGRGKTARTRVGSPDAGQT